MLKQYILRKKMSKRIPKKSLTVKLNQTSFKNNIFSYKDIMPGVEKQKDRALAQIELASNLEVVSSQAYQDLLGKLRIMKAQKQPVLEQLRAERKQRKQELKGLYKDKNKVKMDIWDRIGKICKLKEDIEVEKQRREMLDQFFSERIIQQADQDANPIIQSATNVIANND